MGFRTTFVTEHTAYNTPLPEWFTDKYPNWSYNGEKNCLGFAQVYESKFYDKFSEDERFLDIQKVLKELKLTDIVIVLLHECGGITRVKITQNSISAREPKDWKEVEQVEHDYCYGCSDFKELKN
jgi:hypothetical protein